MRILTASSLLVALLQLCWTIGAAAQAPQVLHTPFYQGPVRGHPGERLIISGENLHPESTVHYCLVQDPHNPPALPCRQIFPRNTGISGTCTIEAEPRPDPNHRSLVVTLALEMERDSIYALAVEGPEGGISETMLINDPRPRWISPNVMINDTDLDPVSLMDDHIKIIGRNLRPNRKTRVRFTDQATGQVVDVTRVADPTGTELDGHAILSERPNLDAGEYQVSLRQGNVWYEIEGGILTVQDPHPMSNIVAVDEMACTPAELEVGTECPAVCEPDDGENDAFCLRRAIDEVLRNGPNGTVYFGPGDWEFSNWNVPSSFEPRLHGVLVNQGVSLQGVPGSTRLVRQPDWAAGTTATLPILTLEGHQSLTGLTLHEQVVPGQLPTAHASLLLLSSRNIGHPVTRPERILITGCTFSSGYYGIGNGIFPVDRVWIIDNLFHNYSRGLELNGASRRAYPTIDFGLGDSVIAHNTFTPGAYLHTLASEIGGARNLDFSGNDTAGIPTNGSRAGFFFALPYQQDNVLVSENTGTCVGTRPSKNEGEFIATEENGNVQGFDEAKLVTTAEPYSVTVKGNWGALDPAHAWLYPDLTIAPRSHVGDWVTVVDGPGQGQRRKIRHHETGPNPTIIVYPEWDILPVGARVTVGGSVHAMAIVNNYVNNTDCESQNQVGFEGSITLDASCSDLVVEGNTQVETGGIYSIQRVDVERYGTCLDPNSCPVVGTCIGVGSCAECSPTQTCQVWPRRRECCDSARVASRTSRLDSLEILSNHILSWAQPERPLVVNGDQLTVTAGIKFSYGGYSQRGVATSYNVNIAYNRIYNAVSYFPGGRFGSMATFESASFDYSGPQRLVIQQNSFFGVVDPVVADRSVYLEYSNVWGTVIASNRHDRLVDEQCLILASNTLVIRDCAP